MSVRRRTLLITIGVCIICISIIIIGSVSWPAEVLRAQATLAPTMFINP